MKSHELSRAQRVERGRGRTEVWLESGSALGVGHAAGHALLLFCVVGHMSKKPGQEGVGFRLLVVPNRDFSHSFWWYRHLWLVLQMVVLLSECKKLLKTRMMMKGSNMQVRGPCSLKEKQRFLKQQKTVDT